MSDSDNKTRGLGNFNCYSFSPEWEMSDIYESETYKIPVSSIKVNIKNYKGFNINKRKLTNSYGLIFR